MELNVEQVKVNRGVSSFSLAEKLLMSTGPSYFVCSDLNSQTKNFSIKGTSWGALLKQDGSTNNTLLS